MRIRRVFIREWARGGDRKREEFGELEKGE